MRVLKNWHLNSASVMLCHVKREIESQTMKGKKIVFNSLF
jgi:hypothetical protein